MAGIHEAVNREDDGSRALARLWLEECELLQGYEIAQGRANMNNA